MRIIDISMTIRPDMPTYMNRGDNRPEIIINRDFPRDNVRDSNLLMNLHAGTHLDSPMHMMAGGEPTLSLPLEKLITAAKVIDVTEAAESVGREHLEKHDIRADDFVLLKTANSFDPLCGGADFVFLNQGGAAYLAQKGIKGLGIDTLGIERAQPGHESHITLLRRGIIILEGLELRHVAPGGYLLICLPVKIDNAEGAPTRAVLIEGAELR